MILHSNTREGYDSIDLTAGNVNSIEVIESNRGRFAVIKGGAVTPKPSQAGVEDDTIVAITENDCVCITDKYGFTHNNTLLGKEVIEKCELVLNAAPDLDTALTQIIGWLRLKIDEPRQIVGLTRQSNGERVAGSLLTAAGKNQDDGRETMSDNR